VTSRDIRSYNSAVEFKCRSIVGKLAERVTKFVANYVGMSPEQITPSFNLIKDLGGQKNNTLSLKTAIQEEFGIDIEDTEFDRLVTLQDVIDLVVYS
jgi:acyl carrier protein